MAGITISQRLSNKIKDNVAQEKIIKLRDKKILELNDKIGGLETQLGIEEAKVRKWELMQERGYTAVTINDDMITNAVKVLPFSRFVHMQDIPTHILAPLYKSYPFYQLDQNGKIVQNPQKYNRYIGGYTL